MIEALASRSTSQDRDHPGGEHRVALYAARRASQRARRRCWARPTSPCTGPRRPASRATPCSRAGCAREAPTARGWSSSCGAALDGTRSTVHYQPEVDLRTGEVTGAEALVRWRHPERGLLEPAQFLFVAEASDLIVATRRPRAAGGLPPGGQLARAAPDSGPVHRLGQRQRAAARRPRPERQDRPGDRGRPACRPPRSAWRSPSRP